MNVAIFVFDQIQILDFTGPMDVFSTKTSLFRPYTVGSTKAAITTTGGLSVNPTYSFADAPQADILIIPGGSVGQELEKDAVITWIRDQAKQAQHVLSICTGSFLIAKAGLLDGLTTTTYHSAIPRMEAFGSQYKVVRDQRFVDNGKVICSAGISSGIDAAFHLVSKTHGMGVAQEIALRLEFDWQPQRNYARAALADLKLPQFPLPEATKLTISRTEGDRLQWFTSGKLEIPLSAQVLGDRLENFLTDNGYQEVTRQTEDKTFYLRWQKQESDALWTGYIQVDTAAEPAYLFKMEHQKSHP